MIVPLLANSLGATIIEKHITLDRSKKGIDYYAAFEPDEFKHFVKLVRMSNKALTNGDLSLNRNELEYRKKHKKNAIANYLIKRNTVLEEKMFDFKRTNSRRESISYFDFVGKRVEKNIPKGSVITSDFLDKKSHKVVAVLACRIGSGRLFAKPLQPVGDRTILELIISQLKTSSILDEIILAISENPGNEVFENLAKEKNWFRFSFDIFINYPNGSAIWVVRIRGVSVQHCQRNLSQFDPHSKKTYHPHPKNSTGTTQ